MALVDDDIRRAETLAARLNGPLVFSTMTGLIAAGAAEAEVIATRAESHLALAGQAVSAGLSVLVEKPLANSAEDIREFQRRFGQVKTAIMVDHLCLFHSLLSPLLARLRKTGFRGLHFTRHRPERVGRHFPADHPIQLAMIHDLYVAAHLAAKEEPTAFSAMEGRNADGRVDMS